MINMINTPDILPNNLRIIRQMRGKTTDETANALGLNRSYISVLENDKANMSGVAAISIMNYLNTNFFQLFEKEESIFLDYTEKELKNHRLKILTSIDNLPYFQENDIINVVEIIQKELDELNINGKVFEFEYMGHTKIEAANQVYILINVTTSEEITTKKEFDLRLSSNLNTDLFKALVAKGFERKAELIVDKDNFKIDNDHIVLNKNYRIVQKDNLSEITNVINIDSNKCDITYNNKNEIKSVKFNVILEDLYNIDFIEKFLGLTPEEIQEVIGISENGYNEIFSGNQKISTKIMWRLVKYFKVPLEYIINLKLYTEKYIKL